MILDKLSPSNCPRGQEPTMMNPYEAVQRLTSVRTLPDARRAALRDFAQSYGWRPSYELVEPSYLQSHASAHLVVEHGLQPSALISFVTFPTTASDLPRQEQNDLLTLSYNTLVDWHLYVDYGSVTFSNNRLIQPVVLRETLQRDDTDSLIANRLVDLARNAANPQTPNLEDSLIRTISHWKRILMTDVTPPPTNSDLSRLFNAIIFVRAMEDYSRSADGSSSSAVLQQHLDSLTHPTVDFRHVINSALIKLTLPDIPLNIIEPYRLTAFTSVDRLLAIDLVRDFYRNRFAPYRYDFSIMSKHALSRIYERYAAILEFRDSNQLSFIPTLPAETFSKSTGAVYTPEFLARFFGRYLRDHLSPRTFRSLQIMDPACGSGIFLRTIIEMQAERYSGSLTTEDIGRMFSNLHGVDVDENATQATTLSLSLLHLILTGTFPASLDIVNSDSFALYDSDPRIRNSVDVVVMNPPFVSVERQSTELRNAVSEFMGGESRGRVDLYLAFLELSIRLLRPGGIGLVVLPHSFLLSDAARSMRRRLSSDTTVLVLADLSEIRVFDTVDTYVVLIIFQKKPVADGSSDDSVATIVKCRDFVGHALEDALDEKSVENSSYSIYSVPQATFLRDTWDVLPPAESRIARQLESLPPLESVARVTQGIVTGADNIFIVPTGRFGKRERSVWAPLLPDREMERYSTPSSTDTCVFYPYVDGRWLTDAELEGSFPETWLYLKQHQGKLADRAPVRRGNAAWWMPAWPRVPSQLLGPKIVSPHLVLAPRFGLDALGKYVVTRGSIITLRDSDGNLDLLKFLTAVLNSSICYWYISTHSHKYSRGYSMLEGKTLRKVPIPDYREYPAEVARLIRLVELIMRDPSSLHLQEESEEIVTTMYGLTPRDLEALGLR